MADFQSDNLPKSLTGRHLYENAIINNHLDQGQTTDRASLSTLLGGQANDEAFSRSVSHSTGGEVCDAANLIDEQISSRMEENTASLVGHHPGNGNSDQGTWRNSKENEKEIDFHYPNCVCVVM